MTTATAESLTNTQALHALRLPSMSRSWQEIAAEATEQAWTHKRFLGALCHLKLNERGNRRLAAALRTAKLPPGKRLDSFEFCLVPGLSRQRVEALCAGDWVKAQGNCLLFGGSGTGKSHIAAVIAYGLIEAGHTALFIRTNDLVQRLQAARRDLALLREHRSAVLTQAAAFILNRWAALCRFLEAGYLPLDNNPADQALRPDAIGRKNHLFVASKDGGDWLATNLTIFQTCRLMGIDPIDYLRDVLPGIITGRTTDLLAVTPRAYLAQMADVRTA